MEVVFLFDRIDPAKVRTDPRPPRGNPGAAPVGIFAHRGPYRPNRLDVSRCRLLAVDGLNVHVADLDKPYLIEFAPPPSGHPTGLGHRAHELLQLRFRRAGARRSASDQPGRTWTTLTARVCDQAERRCIVQ
ncbi:TrmO family methyltransferase [Nonomuraea sp. NPDC047529]|uniref:TrmO family methyltransferase domain-containing protein n=1 Tax=Nonomuraea sp. NPDC047529 TaxID=3155623 RepID=UPI0033C154E5